MPKASVVGDTPSTGCGGTVPVPVALTVALPPLLVTLIVAVFEPVLPGLKATVKV